MLLFLARFRNYDYLWPSAIVRASSRESAEFAIKQVAENLNTITPNDPKGLKGKKWNSFLLEGEADENRVISEQNQASGGMMLIYAA